MDFFLLKKVMGTLLMPLSVVLILGFLALFMFHLRPLFARICLTLSLSLLLLLSLNPVSSQLMQPLEAKYTIYQKKGDEKIDYIVILGCVGETDNRWPASAQLKPCALERLVEGIRIASLHPEASIITTGYGLDEQTPHAELMKQAAMSLGIDERKLLTEPFARDTEEEAELVAPRIKNQKAILVTSANHMPRAIGYFKQFGSQPIAAPASPKVKMANENSSWAHWTPTVNNLYQATIAWYELLGQAWQWLKQKLA